jgi:hypothetical protein
MRSIIRREFFSNSGDFVFTLVFRTEAANWDPLGETKRLSIRCLCEDCELTINLTKLLIAESFEAASIRFVLGPCDGHDIRFVTARTPRSKAEEIHLHEAMDV